MSTFEIKDGVLHAEDVSLKSIASSAGTPCYVYSASGIRQQYQALVGALANALPADRQPKLHYACKANSNIAVLRLLKNEGCGLEIVSEGELIRGLKAGFQGNEIISTSFGKDEQEIKACLQADILQFNVEYTVELETINKIAASMGKKPDILFRLNPDVSGGGHHKISTGRKGDKFGMSADSITEAYARAHDMDHLNPIGVSMHIGSQVFTVESFKPAFERLASLVKELRESGHEVTRLDLGGGFPIIYNDEKLLDLDAYARWVNEIIVPLDTDIQMEPGRYMVGNAGVLLSEVIYSKEIKDQNFLVLDSAMNDLIRPTLYEAWHNIRPVTKHDTPKVLYDVVGPICESGDTFAKERSLPAMTAGDLVVFESAGAYGAAMSSNYNTRPLPTEVLVDGDRFAIIRQKQEISDILKGEAIPDWLK